MPVNIIDTLKPKNGLSFPVVEAIDVFVDGFDNLADAVSHFATDVMIEAINVVLSGKANTSDVNTAVSGLQAQIDQIAQAAGTGSADTEIAQARVDANSKSYSLLKNRLDATDGLIADLSSELKVKLLDYSLFTEADKYINRNDYTSNPNFVSTSFLPIGNIKRFKFFKTAAQTDGYTIAFYSSNSFASFISGERFNAISEAEVVEIPSDANYYICSQRKTGAFEAFAYTTTEYSNLVDEVINARTNAEGTAASSLKARLDAADARTEEINDAVNSLREELGEQPITQSLFTETGKYVNRLGWVENANFESTDFLPVNGAKEVKFFKTSAQSDGYTISFYSSESIDARVDGVLLDNISEPQAVSIPSDAEYYICCKRIIGNFEATRIEAAAYNDLANEVIDARTTSSGQTYNSLKARLDAIESSSSGIGDKYVPTFDSSCLSIQGSNIHYDGTPLAQNHQNYVYLKNTTNVNTFSFGFKGFTSRCGIELTNGFKIYIVTLKKSGQEPDYFGCDIYNGNTQIISGKVLANDIAWGTANTQHLLTVAKNGNYILIYVDGTLLAYITNSVFNQNIRRIGYAFKSEEPITYSEIIYNQWEQYAHISFDDQISVLKVLAQSEAESIYDIPAFKTLHDAHLEYGCTFTLMLFYEDAQGWDLSNMPTTYKNEFEAASDWLKFAYHSHYTTGKAAEDMTAEELVEDMQLMYATISGFASDSAIDYCPRLGYFSCTKEQAIAISAAGLVTGLLTADDVRDVNCGLTSAEKAIMKDSDRMSDYYNGLLYCRTRTRLDGLTAEEIVTTLNSQYNRNNTKAYEIFSHSINQTMVETVADWLSKKSIKYGFAMDNIDF